MKQSGATTHLVPDCQTNTPLSTPYPSLTVDTLVLDTFQPNMRTTGYKEVARGYCRKNVSPTYKEAKVLTSCLGKLVAKQQKRENLMATKRGNNAVGGPASHAFLHAHTSATRSFYCDL